MNLYIARHGNTFEANETPFRIGSRTDLPLVKSGIYQSVDLALHFRNKGIVFDKIICAPLLRTRLTASLILAISCSNESLIESKEIIEIDHGIDEGKSDELILERIGLKAFNDWDDYCKIPVGWNPSESEIIGNWIKVIQPYLGLDNILVVTSNGIARFALKAFGVELLNKKHKLSTGAYGQINFSKDQNELICWNVKP